MDGDLELALQVGLRVPEFLVTCGDGLVALADDQNYLATELLRTQGSPPVRSTH